ncbi:MAG: hypothetical protein H0V17_35155, partial [Deltaproteobacteria bacterium]|nr:hypothetical protein [Deltaproteobacteria bacterium]
MRTFLVATLAITACAVDPGDDAGDCLTGKCDTTALFRDVTAGTIGTTAEWTNKVDL